MSYSTMIFCDGACRICLIQNVSRLPCTRRSTVTTPCQMSLGQDVYRLPCCRFAVRNTTSNSTSMYWDTVKAYQATISVTLWVTASCELHKQVIISWYQSSPIYAASCELHKQVILWYQSSSIYAASCQPSCFMVLVKCRHPVVYCFLLAAQAGQGVVQTVIQKCMCECMYRVLCTNRFVSI